MPDRQYILDALERIARDNVTLAVVWHLVIAAALLALVAGGWRPTRRTAAALCALPVLSASAAAWSTGNPFNTALLLVVAGALAIAATRLSRGPVRRGPPWAVAAGGAAIAFAWVYPHFLPPGPVWPYLFAAPLGLVPCPTLAVVIGFGLIAGGFSRAWSLVASLAGLFYSLFGMLRLGVWLDAGLFMASCAMLVLVFFRRGRRWPANMRKTPRAAV